MSTDNDIEWLERWLNEQHHRADNDDPMQFWVGLFTGLALSACLWAGLYTVFRLVVRQ